MAQLCLAHIRPQPDGPPALQTAADHCRNTARLAAERLAPLGLGQTAYLAGLVHDMGKFTARFEDYLRRAAAGERVRRGSVNHTFAGVRFLLERYHAPTCASIQDVACEVLAYAAGAHHGLFDCIGPDGGSGFLHRLKKEDICYEEARDHFLAQCAQEEELDRLFQQAADEVTAVHRLLLESAKGDVEGAFLYGLLCRLVLSAVIDADRLDTAGFLGAPVPPVFPADLTPVWRDCLARVEDRLGQFAADTPIARARRDISDQCRRAARHSGGVRRLNVPTGSGKTLASLRYALAHAAEHGKQRIFFVIPLLSVIEQNAGVIRDFVGDDRLILEHHSNVTREREDGELDPRELLAETWSAPIVLTTLVQLLNTLFLGKTTSIRRMNALADSVIVIDEIQSLPRSMLSQFNLAMNFLSEVCGAAVVLCSATQPCLEALPHPLHYGPQPDLVPFSPPLWDVFRRTRVLDCRDPGGWPAERLAQFVSERMDRVRSLLLICNTKGQALDLYRRLQGGDFLLYHLSTAMCMAHRIETLRAVTEALDRKERVVCVSTQLVEAGVDFSFEAVIRVLAGMDNAAQATGRCNRGGEFGRLCPVCLVDLQGEDLSRLPELLSSQRAAEELLTRFQRDGAPFGGDLLSGESISFYYHKLFAAMEKNAADYPLPELSATLVDLLARNQALGAHAAVWREQRYWLNQAFHTAGAAFRVFSSQTFDVLVPYRAGADLISALGSQRAEHDLSFCKSLLEQAKPYTVSVYDHQLRRLAQAGGLCRLNTVQTVLPGFYDDQTGFCLDPTLDYMEV